MATMTPESYLKIVIVMLFMIFLAIVALDVILIYGFEAVVPDLLEAVENMNSTMDQIAND